MDDGPPSPDLVIGSFTDHGPWVVDPDAMPWRADVDRLREQARAEYPRWMETGRLPPLVRLVKVVGRVGGALGAWAVGARRKGPPSSRIDLSRRLRIAFGHLGPTYIKLGQIVSGGDRLPVQPSTGDDFELGATKGFANRMRFDATTYRRQARNAADDDQLLNTGVSYPISFDKSVIYGAEGKLQVTSAGPVSGFVSYSYMVAMEWFPVTGGLFLGQDAMAAASRLSGHFPGTQDQRNTLVTRWETKTGSRLRFAAGASCGSGLPFAYGGSPTDALAQYGPQVVSRLDFARGRIHPQFSVNASMSADIVHRDHFESTLHIDGENLTDRLNLLDFGGLFSGNAIAPARTVLMRLETHF